MKKDGQDIFTLFITHVSKTFLINYLNKKGFKIVKEKNLEPPIIGTFLLTYGVNKSIKFYQFFLSIAIYTVKNFLVLKQYY